MHRATQVCHPQKDVKLTQEAWEAVRQKWAAQQKSPFVQYKLQKLSADGGPLTDLTEEQFAGARVLAVCACSAPSLTRRNDRD